MSINILDLWKLNVFKVYVFYFVNNLCWNILKYCDLLCVNYGYIYVKIKKMFRKKWKKIN